VVWTRNYAETAFRSRESLISRPMAGRGTVCRPGADPATSKRPVNGVAANMRLADEPLAAVPSTEIALDISLMMFAP
jgi:hypothetical protein